MHIAVDYQSSQGKRTGIGVFASNLCSEISDLKPEWKFSFQTNSKERDLNTPKRIFWESCTLPIRMMSLKPDIVYSPGFAPAIFSPVKQIVTVHDLIGMIYPLNLPLGARFYWSYWLPLCVKRASVCIASSESTRNDMVRLLGMDSQKIRVVPLDANAVYRTPADMQNDAVARFGLKKPFLVTVGTLEPRKNLMRLVQAVNIIKKSEHLDFQIAVCGKGGGQQELIISEIKKYGLEDTIKLLGYVSDEDIRDLYHASEGYCIVSLYEGFGLPVLEAMCCGRSGVCSDRSSLPEVAGDAAVYVNPESTDNIADGIIRFLSDHEARRSLNVRAVEMSEKFSWKKTAMNMIDVFLEVENAKK
ncbi:MAG: glycosyltransferase family 4 protein [Candidatus Omnitrophica bacterium]|nr:glycosyltransferase family 4 protein [Candidatus Omnitrophota bacterium]